MTSPNRQNIPAISLALLSAIIGAFLLSNCGHNAGDVVEVPITDGYQASHGPFDRHGNYIEQWADSPPKRRYVNTAKTQPEPHRPPNISAVPQRPTPVVASNYTPTRPTASKTAPRPAVTKSTPKPKPVLVKAKPKTAASHTVRRGETLYALSRKYGVTVSAIQKANRISGTNIRIGQRLTIPR